MCCSTTRSSLAVITRLPTGRYIKPAHFDRLGPGSRSYPVSGDPNEIALTEAAGIVAREEQLLDRTPHLKIDEC